MPQIGQVVYCQVRQVLKHQATLSILALEENNTLTSSFAGVLKPRDISEIDPDSVVMSNCMNVNDIVRAVIISLGDARSFYLSICKEEYGVMYAYGPAGTLMDRVDFNTFHCNLTNTTEKRKGAHVEQLPSIDSVLKSEPSE